MPSVIAFRLFLFLGLILIVDVFTCISLNSFTKNWKHATTKWIVNNSPWIITVLFFLFALSYVLAVANAEYDYIKARHYYNIFGVLIIIIILKAIFTLFKLIERLSYYILYFVYYIFNKRKSFNKQRIVKRSASVFFIAGSIFALISLSLLIYGMKWGKYNFEIEKHEIYFNNLPKSFDGIKIIQISDTHFGSLPDTTYMSKVVNVINQQKPDFIFYTGDMSNNQTLEAKDYIPLFQRLKSKYGKFAVLGNHDMGDYRRWYTESGKISDYYEVVKVYDQMGFRVLMDENCYTKIDNDSIAIIGVKSWSLPPFKKLGDLKKAMKGVPASIFKILLTHNPSHWEKEVLGKTNIDLTFSGHTHGMQISLYEKNFRWSPAQYKYPYWAGLYNEGNQYINVNRGIGFLGFSIRIGVRPEITLVVLKRNK